MLLQATSKRNPLKVKLLLTNHMFTPVEGDIMADEPVASKAIEDIFKDVEVKHVHWRWPSGRAFRDVQGVSELAILGLLKDRGVPVDFTTEYDNVQVPDDASDALEWVSRENHLEIVMNVTDAHYDKLCKKYGEIALV